MGVHVAGYVHAVMRACAYMQGEISKVNGPSTVYHQILMTRLAEDVTPVSHLTFTDEVGVEQLHMNAGLHEYQYFVIAICTAVNCKSEASACNQANRPCPTSLSNSEENLVHHHVHRHSKCHVYTYVMTKHSCHSVAHKCSIQGITCQLSN